MGETFLLTIHTDDRKYKFVTLRANVKDTCSDVIKQVLALTKRYDADAALYAIIEELSEEMRNARHSGTICRP